MIMNKILTSMFLMTFSLTPAIVNAECALGTDYYPKFKKDRIIERWQKRISKSADPDLRQAFTAGGATECIIIKGPHIGAGVIPKGLLLTDKRITILALKLNKTYQVYRVAREGKFITTH